MTCRLKFPPVWLQRMARKIPTFYSWIEPSFNNNNNKKSRWLMSIELWHIFQTKKMKEKRSIFLIFLPSASRMSRQLFSSFKVCTHTLAYLRFPFNPLDVWRIGSCWFGLCRADSYSQQAENWYTLRHSLYYTFICVPFYFSTIVYIYAQAHSRSILDFFFRGRARPINLDVAVAEVSCKW